MTSVSVRARARKKEAGMKWVFSLPLSLPLFFQAPQLGLEPDRALSPDTVCRDSEGDRRQGGRSSHYINHKPVIDRLMQYKQNN